MHNCIYVHAKLQLESSHFHSPWNGHSELVLAFLLDRVPEVPHQSLKKGNFAGVESNSRKKWSIVFELGISGENLIIK